MNPVELVIITGESGAGKTEAMHAFEDSGYFCVDNLPPRMLGALGELFRHEGSGVERAAVACDVRGGEYFEELVAVLEEIERGGVVHLTLLFLEAEEQALLDRFKETRRRHPLAPGGRVLDGIRRERELLGALRERADLVMDTTGLTGAMLRRRIATEMLGGKPAGKLALTILTFGFKHGAPRDADLVFDVRFLPNPHYEPELRPLTGLDPPVAAFIEADGAAGEFYAHLFGLLDFLLPAYIAEGKTHLTLALGCTGGRHRSLCVARRLADRLAERDDVVLNVVHRDTAGAGAQRPAHT